MEREGSKKRRKVLTMTRKRMLWNGVFLLPWLIGFLLFFLKPLLESFIYSFQNISLQPGKVLMEFVGLQNFQYVLTEHGGFNSQIITTVVGAIPQVILIIFFAMFSAVLLNGKFRGRVLARGIFFLPVIMSAGLISLSLESGSGAALQTAAGEGEGLLNANAIAVLLFNMGVPRRLIGYVMSVVSNVFEVVTMSGIQTLIFLAGLQAISPSLYEVAKIEGATSYETFWKVTLPMLSPLILTCTVFSFTEAFARSPVIETARYIAFSANKYGYGAAMNVVFLLVSVAIIGLSGLIISRKVFYYD